MNRKLSILLALVRILTNRGRLARRPCASNPPLANLALTFVIASVLPCPAQTVVNLDARDDCACSAGSGISVPLSAGRYRVEAIGPAAGGQFTAYNPWGETNGCDALGENCANGWQVAYAYDSPSLGTRVHAANGVFATPAQALAGSPEQDLWVRCDETVSFWIIDSCGSCVDNDGGVSLRITPLRNHVTSSGHVWVRPLLESPGDAEVNSGPPPFPAGWTLVDPNDTVRRHRDLHAPGSFDCSDPNLVPLDEPFVSTLEFILGADEVTWDNCQGAWYRSTFDVPVTARNRVLSLRANVDDLGVAWLNGTRISSAVGPSDLDDFLDGEVADRVDGAGLPLLNWPTPDVVIVCADSLFVAGENTLVFGVIGDASPLEPTGIEFEAGFSFDLGADVDLDGSVNITDLAVVLANFGTTGAGRSEGDTDLDTDVDLTDLGRVLADFGESDE